MAIMYLFTPLMPSLFLKTSISPSFLNDYLGSQPLSMMLFVYFLFMQEVFVKEKAEGSLETVLSSPIRPIDLWLSKTIAVFVLSYIVMVLLSSAFITISFIFLGNLTISLTSALSFLGLLPLVSLFFFGISGILALALKNANQAGLPIILLAVLIFFLRNNIFDSLTQFIVPLFALIGFLGQYFYVKKMSRDRVIMAF